MNQPLRLRDLRRIVARRRSKWTGGSAALRAAGLLVCHNWGRPVVQAPHGLRLYEVDVDRLISRHGPDAIARDILLPPDPPDTCPVAGECPASQGDGAHCSDDGDARDHPQSEGDRNDQDLNSPSRPDRDSAAQVDASAASGSCGDGVPVVGSAAGVRAEPSGDGCPTGSCAPADAGASVAREPSESEVPRGAAGDDDVDDIPVPVGAEDGARSDRTPGGATPDAKQEAPEGGPVTSGVPDDLSELTTPDPASPTGQASDPFHEDPPGDDGSRERIPVWTPGYHPGTDHLVEDYVAELRGRTARDARVCARELRRLLADTPGLGLDPSPRLDHRRLVAELVTRRYALSRAQRRELAPGLVLLLADVSGSCSAVCSSTVAAARALAAEMSVVLVIEHANGEVQRASGQVAPRAAAAMRGRPRGAYNCWPRISAVVAALGIPVRAAIAWGDTDASDDYRLLVEAGVTLWWLDSYRCSELSRPAPLGDRTRAEICQGWRRQPAAMWAGVNSARRTAQALRQIRRGRLDQLTRQVRGE